MDSPLLARFFPALTAAARRVLLLDYDGTLAPFHTERGKAQPYPGVREALNNMLAAQHTRIVLISGRPATEVAALLALETTPEIWGTHGLERLRPGRPLERLPLPTDVEHALKQAREWIYTNGFGEYLEEKPGCLALHWRGQPTALVKEIHDQVAVGWSRFATPPLALGEFDGGLELRCTLYTKGDAVDQVLAEEPAEAVCAYLGDDLTDEDAFARLAGRGIRVLVRLQRRETLADVWLQPPGELLDFLSRWHQACLTATSPEG